MSMLSRSDMPGEYRSATRWLMIVGAFHFALSAAPLRAETRPRPISSRSRSARLIVEKCQSCHGDKKAKAGLRLTDRESLLKGGESGPAVVPERSGREPAHPGGALPRRTEDAAEAEAVRRPRSRRSSAGWRRVRPGHRRPTGNDDARRASSRPPHIERWWAFQPVRSEPPPAVDGPDGAANEIDAFLLDALRSQGITPAPPADRRTWIRRATFDLTGLPPTPEEVDGVPRGRFGRGVRRRSSIGCWPRRPTASAGRGTGSTWSATPTTTTATRRPARPVASRLEAWRYRDWVVDAFNRDLPFDQFIVHQIAGDLLPSPDGEEFYADGLIATTFLSNGVWDRGDADKEKMVSDMVDDQIDTVGKAFLGLTLGCARCHDHKFDPISQQDYYALAGIFYSTHILKDLGTKGGEYTLQPRAARPRRP